MCCGDCVLTVVVCVVSGSFAAVTELIKTTFGVVENRVKHDAVRVEVSRRLARRSVLTLCLQLYCMGMTEVPSELFRMEHVKTLDLNSNMLCSLPSEIALMTTLEKLYVRLAKRLDRDLTKSRCFRCNSTSLCLFRPRSVC